MAIAVDVGARIAELVDRHRPELEQLVDRELDRQLERLVIERIAARNGATCSRCGNEPRLRGRTIGLACKRAADTARARARKRERRAPAAAAADGDDGPRQAADAQTG